MYLKANSLDDLLRKTIKRLLRQGKVDNNVPKKGKNKELIGVILELSNPLARLSRTETKGKVFSCLGELLWYLAKSNELDFISYYIKDYPQYSDDEKTLYGAYGPRIFDGNPSQYQSIKALLQTPGRIGSRKILIPIIRPDDIISNSEDVPCTCSLQFFIRDGFLHLLTHMRSNDVMKGLPHDIFAFTMLQEILARDLSLNIGTYKHSVASLHLYHEDFATAKKFLDEGIQEFIQMPNMPNGNPWPSIQIVLDAEEKIRKGQVVDASTLELNEYWKDLIRLLQVLPAFRSGKISILNTIRKEMHSSIYEEYILAKHRATKPLQKKLI